MRLLFVTREAVQDPPVRQVILLETFLDDSDSELVRSQAPVLDVALDLRSEFAAFSDRPPEDVAGRDRDDPELLCDARTLSALARSLGAKDEDAHDDYLRKPS
jgi:hypothetical protein